LEMGSGWVWRERERELRLEQKKREAGREKLIKKEERDVIVTSTSCKLL